MPQHKIAPKTGTRMCFPWFAFWILYLLESFSGGQQRLPKEFSVVVVYAFFLPANIATLSRGRKKHITCFNLNFWPPPKTPDLGPPEKSLCASFPGKERKKVTHMNLFGGILGVKNGVPNGPFSATQSLLSFLPLPSACYRSPKPRTCPKSKTRLHWCTRLLGDPFSSWSKHLLHPLLTTLGNFEICSRHLGSGVARGLLQGRPLQLPMAWGVGEELTKSWPIFEQLGVQNLAWVTSYCLFFFSYQERTFPW